MAKETPGVASTFRAGESTPQPSAFPPRVFILSDVRLLCDGLSLALARQSSIIVLGVADLATSPTTIAALQPDVLLLDVAMPGGLDALLPLRLLLPAMKVVAIAVAEVEQELVGCAAAGVSGFVPRHGSVDDVVAAVHGALKGELACSPRTAALLFGGLAALASRRNGATSDSSVLTRREQEIVALVGDGLSNKEIARRLRIQNPTVKNHIHSILGKLHLRRRGEVAAQLHRTAPREQPGGVAAASPPPAPPTRPRTAAPGSST